MAELFFSSLLESTSGWVTELRFSSTFAASFELDPFSVEDLEAFTNGTFSLTGEAGSATTLPASSTEVAAGGGDPLKPQAISSKVRPLVSGTLKYVKMKKKMRKIMNIMKTYGPHSSCNSQAMRRKVNSDIVHTI